MQVDAVVNTANPSPVIGPGVDREIHQRAGYKLLKARKRIGHIGFGDAAITPGFDLEAKYVIHTVGPVWVDGKHNEKQILSSCYRKSLAVAKAHGWEFIFLGANIDALAEAKRFGISESMATNYCCDEIGTRLNYEVISEAITSVRTNSAPLSSNWKKRIDEDYDRRGSKR